jgi:LPPG:FO 2-phospho-L-lactate transferase
VPVRPALTVLAGGVGAARFLRGLIRIAEPSALTIVVNTADDERFYGLAVSPDLDTVTYTLAGVANPRTGWGRRDDSFACLAALARFYGPAWFHLGDRDLATHLYRTERLAAGATLATVTREIGRAFGLRATVLPMSNDPVRTVLDTSEGRLAFQRYLVERRARPAVRAVHYLGAARARPAPGVLRAIRRAAAVIIAPSNPLLSIGPILAVPGVRRALAARRGPVAAVSPLVTGRAVSGPLARLLRGFALPASSEAIAAAYRPFLDTLVIDRRDRADVRRLAALGCRAVVTDTVFATPARATRAARDLLHALRLD